LSPVIGRSPDAPGRVFIVTNRRPPRTTFFPYTTLFRSSVTQPLGETTTFAYDSSDRLASSVEPRGNVSGCGCASTYTTSYAYDNADNLLSSTDHLGNTSSVSYDDAGNQLTRTNALNNTW